MKKQKNLKRDRHKFFKTVLFLLLLHVCVAAGASDLLDRAVSLEREGNIEEARILYIQWLSKSDSSNSERFGRILIHTLRMAAPLEEDLKLIETHLGRVKSTQDLKDVLKTALILSELSGNHKLIQYYLSAINSLDRNPSDGASDTDPLDSRLTLTSDIKYEYIAALKENAESSRLLLWIDRTHKQYPPLINEPDWLYILQKVLGDAGYTSQSEIFKKRLINDFPDSVEVSLLNKQVSLLSNPDDLFTGAEDSAIVDEFFIEEISSEPPGKQETVPQPDSSSEYILYQAGAFRDYANASALKTDLEQAGLICIMKKEGTVYKVIVESRDDVNTLRVFKEKNLQAFRIPRLP